MVEVFKTNVTSDEQANRLLEKIHASFSHYKANFDLEDCDKVLRIKCMNGDAVEASCLLKLLHELGVEAKILPDEPAVSKIITPHSLPRP